ncbi:endospore germination permease [Cohnella silvisoli]|uniref:Endospore germination permease n=1 Tax=Cohnella silvisoli TaxID=2873699 RepID=A0ABV1KZ12_9BACL|nr:endospore germination permease [Cohnella silvisoli]MCD9021793.1 spore germination protein [Cohnella silvisoli]
MQNQKINVVQAVFLFALAVGITNHVIIVPLILNSALRDSWISPLIALPPLLLWTTILFLIMKLTKQKSLYIWFKTHYNPLVASLVIAPIILFVFLILFVTIRDTTAWTKITYLPKTPFPVIVGLYVFAGFIAALTGLRTITIAAGILFPAVIMFGFFVMSVNYQFKDYSYLLPVFTNGYAPALKGTIYVLGGLVEFILLLSVQQHLSKKMRFSTLILMTLAVTCLIFGPVIASIAIFGPYEAADQRYPSYEQWRMVLIGKFISHLDFLSIYQWLSGSLVRISLALFLLFDLLHMTHHRKKWIWMFITCVALIVMVTRLNLSDAIFFEFLQRYYFPYTLSFFYFFPFLLLLLILMKRGKAHHEFT